MVCVCACACVCVCVCVHMQVEDLVPEAEEGSKRADLLGRDLQCSQQEIQTLLKEKADMEQTVS